jgi:hypothetical protein
MEGLKVSPALVRPGKGERMASGRHPFGILGIGLLTLGL